MTTEPRRRWIRFAFRLRTLFVVVTIFGVWFGWQLQVVRERKELHRQLIEVEDAIIWTKGESDSLGWIDLDDTGQIPFWRFWLGDEPLAYISLANTSTIEKLNYIHKMFPEAVVKLGPSDRGKLSEIEELRPGDPPATSGPRLKP